jgi:hypothetical protein
LSSTRSRSVQQRHRQDAAFGFPGSWSSDIDSGLPRWASVDRPGGRWSTGTRAYGKTPHRRMSESECSVVSPGPLGSD